jgi:membrane-associated phospholipid phosphatase
MTASVLTRKDRGATIQSRISPVSRAANLVTFALLAIGIVASIATKFTFASLPNIVLLIVGVLVLDVISQLAPQTRIIEAAQTILYGVLYLVITCVCGVLAAYAIQRFSFPLQDQLLERADVALGLNWFGYAHWVDRHALVQTILHLAYDSLAIQIPLPLIVLACSSRISEARTCLLAFAIAFIVTIVISALMPAAGPIALVDRAAFSVLQFTGATPLDHLTRLREAGPLMFNDPPGGIATFPSFHATVAVLTPLALRSYPRLFIALLIVNAAMLGGTVTEGAHYFVDILAGGGMAFFAYALAKRIIRLEDRSFGRQRNRPTARPYPSTC